MQELILIKKNHLWGFANLNGEIVIEPKFIEAKPFIEGFALVCTKKIPARKLYDNPYLTAIFDIETIENYKGAWDKIWGIINQKGEFVVESTFKSINIVSNGIAIGIKYCGPGKEYRDYCGNHYHLINFKNDNYPPSAGGRYDSFSLFSNKFWFLTYGRSPVGKDQCHTYNLVVNENGEVILNISGKSKMSDFENGIIKISKSSKTSFYNDKGELIAEINVCFENISKNLNGNYFFKENEEYYHFNIIENTISKLDVEIDLTDSEFKSTDFIYTISSY